MSEDELLALEMGGGTGLRDEAGRLMLLLEEPVDSVFEICSELSEWRRCFRSETARNGLESGSVSGLESGEVALMMLETYSEQTEARRDGASIENWNDVRLSSGTGQVGDAASRAILN